MQGPAGYCDQAAAALAYGDAESALELANTAIMMQPDLGDAWFQRAEALNSLQLFADVLASLPQMQAFADADATALQAAHARAHITALFELLPSCMRRTAATDYEERLAAWEELKEADPTSLQARSFIYTDWLQKVNQMREANASSGQQPAVGGPDPREVAATALACLRECAEEAAAFRAALVYEPPPISTLRLGGENLLQFLQMRNPNVPLAAYGEGGVDRAEGASLISSER
jgi:tetratricopeptide (TPR) repeat protein